MNLFIDTISTPAKLIIFNKNKKIIDDFSWEIKWNESSTLLPNIDFLLKSNNTKYSDLENIVVINWPWSFTWVRTTVLTVNTINYIINKNITAISYFKLFNNYPIIKSSSKRDCFVQLWLDKKIEIIENEKLVETLNINWTKKIYWEWDKDLLKNIEIIEKIDYSDIIKNIKYNNAKQIEALYIKKPNIS